MLSSSAAVHLRVGTFILEIKSNYLLAALQWSQFSGLCVTVANVHTKESLETTGVTV